MSHFLLLLFLGSLAASNHAGSQESALKKDTLNVHGGTIYYESLGEGQPLILIHGALGDRRMWDEQLQAFAAEFRVIRYDHRGFGRSSIPQESYSPVADLLQLLDKLGISRAHLVGNSLGGSLAIDFALTHPERVASLVLVASGPNGYPVPQEDVGRVVAVFKAAEVGGLQKAVRLWLAHPMVAVSSKRRGVRERLRTMVTENSKIFRMKDWPSEHMESSAATRLKEIHVPTLVIIGGKDTPLTQMMASETSGQIAGAIKIEMPEADHLPQMVDPATFNRHVLRFLRSLR